MLLIAWSLKSMWVCILQLFSFQCHLAKTMLHFKMCTLKWKKIFDSGLLSFNVKCCQHYCFYIVGKAEYFCPIKPDLKVGAPWLCVKFLYILFSEMTGQSSQQKCCISCFLCQQKLRKFDKSLDFTKQFLSKMLLTSRVSV